MGDTGICEEPLRAPYATARRPRGRSRHRRERHSGYGHNAWGLGDTLRRRPVLVGARRNVHRLDAGGVRLLHGHKVCGLCLKI